MSDVTALITEYLSAGGLFNPELMQHDKVRDMVIQCRDEIESLRSRLAEANSAGFNAARIAYASEFPPNADGKPDVGSIHQNIRAMKARLAEAEALLREARDEQDGCISPGWKSRIDAHLARKP